MKEKAFNLLTEPWILALTPQGETRELSLLEVFVSAHTLKGLAGELAAQDVALLRVLLAVLYAVFGYEDAQGNQGTPRNLAEARRRWKTLWDLGAFPMEAIRAYLLDEDIRERFYLFHPDTPFMQVAIPEDAQVLVDGKRLPINPLAKQSSTLIGDLAESANKLNWFSYRTDKHSLNHGEAARWLLHLNAYDVSPLGAPPRGSFRAKGFKEPWPNTLGLVWAEGDNLFETLMLNFVLAPVGQEVWQDFTPSWERDTPFDPVELTVTAAAFPQEPCALFSYPFRYLQLRRDDADRVTECVVWGGTLIRGEDGNPLTETMTLWKLDKEGRHVPRQHDPSRQMWRDFGAILAGEQAHPPGVVSWLSSLRAHGQLNLPFLRLCIGGMVLSSKKTSVDDAFDDSLRIHASLLESLSDGWVARVNSEVERTERLVRQVGFLAANLVKAAGGSGERDPRAAQGRAREEAYFLLDQPFRQWLESIGEDEEMDAACLRWREEQGRLLRTYGQYLVARSGLKALVGRMVEEKAGGRRAYTAPGLFNRYLGSITKILKE